MTTENNQATDEARIRELIEERVGAIRAKDVDALMSNHAPDVVMFDALDPLRYVGSEAVRERAGQWLSRYQGPVGYEVRDLSVTAGEAVAYCHYLYRVAGTMTNGREVDMWVRSTVCFRKVGRRVGGRARAHVGALRRRERQGVCRPQAVAARGRRVNRRQPPAPTLSSVPSTSVNRKVGRFHVPACFLFNSFILAVRDKNS